MNKYTEYRIQNTAQNHVKNHDHNATTNSTKGQYLIVMA